MTIARYVGLISVVAEARIKEKNSESRKIFPNRKKMIQNRENQTLVKASKSLGKSHSV